MSSDTDIGTNAGILSTFLKFLGTCDSLWGADEVQERVVTLLGFEADRGDYVWALPRERFQAGLRL